MSGVRFLEDIAVGDRDSFGRYEVSAEEILEFARDFDDQPFHTDPVAAKESIYGGLIASGWHTCAMMMRMLIDHAMASGSPAAVLGSPGFDNLKWREPVRPGDVLSVRSEVLEVTPSQSKPDRGHIRVRSEIVNQAGTVVAEMENLAIVLRRPRA